MNYYDLAIVGRGPVGLALAALAAQLNLKTVIIERHRDLYALPRAGHVDHEIVRLFQSLGVADAMLADSYPTTEYVWVNQDGELLLQFDWGAKGISGYNSDYMQFQPVFETALSEKVSSADPVSQLLGWEAQSMVENLDGVVLTLARTEMVPGQARPVATNDLQKIGARYVVAADGANSGVRRLLGIDRDDFGFNEKWLVVDARKKREFSLDFDCGQICDPRRPVTVLPLGKRHRRWEWALLPGETASDLEKPDMAWKLLAEQNVFPDDVEIIRQLVYTFEARHAQAWSKGRIFLAGDAAHTMPPFMGQGMCSGLRDAKNLAWKLDLVFRGISAPSILDTYEQERSPHTRDWTLISLEAGKVPCTLDQEEARLRDKKFRAGWMPPMPNFPKLVEGILASPETRSPAYLNGTLSLQAPVLKDGKIELFDEFFPSTRFVVISTVANPVSVLSQSRIDSLEAIGVWFVHVGNGLDADVRDVDGVYADYFRDNHIEVLIQRPDFYVFGASEKLADLGTLVDDLLNQLHLRTKVGTPLARTKNEDCASAY